jgi:hypothetical protein
MPVRMKLAGGKLGIYTVPSLTSTDDAPLSNPKGNIDRVKLHSDFKYVGIVESRNVVVNAVARQASMSWAMQYTLFAHGRPGVPWIEASLVGTPSIALQGCVPVQWQNGGLARWWAIGATATDVVLYEFGAALYSTAMPAFAKTIRVHVTERMLA